MDLSSTGFSDSSQSSQCQKGAGNPVLPRCASDELTRLSSLNKNDSPPGTGSRPPPVVEKTPPVPPPGAASVVIEEECVEPFDNCGEHFVQRCIIIQRDEKGYGLTVSGDNPVFVQSVKEEGAAARAGVQRGDRIIKVNGTLVTQSNHLEVVKLIKSGSYVALTLLSRLKGQAGQQQDQQQPSPDGLNSSTSSSPSAASPDQPYQREAAHHQLPPQNPHHQQHHLPNSHSFPSSQHPYHHGNMNAANRSSSLSERITAPFPVDAELQQSLNHSRHQTMLQMLEQEKDYLEKIRSAYARAPTPKLKVELRNAQKLIASLEHQVLLMHKSQPTPDVTSFPRSPPMSVRSALGLQLDPPPPPPPPRRHISLPHQSSLPVPPVRVESKLAALSSNNNGGGSCLDLHGNNGSSVVGASPSSPPNHPYPQVDNIQKLNALASSSTTRVHHGIGPCHSRQRSSPDAILHLLESGGCQSRVQRRPEPDLARSHSDVTPSMSTSSSSSAAVSNRKLVKSADSDLELVKRRRTIEGSTVSAAAAASQSGASRASSFGTADSSVSSMTTGSPRVTPPGTPPPPYASFEGQSGEGSERHHHHPHETSTSDESPLSSPFLSISETDECRYFSDSQSNLLPDSFSLTEAPHSSHLGARLTFGAQQPIMSMEDDDFPLDGESGPASDHGPYNSLRQLCCHPGHLSVFIHFLISNSDPSSLFFYLISCMYKEGNAKDMRKWAYEIHSTFLVPGAPLKVSHIEESILHDIDSVLQNDLEKEDILRNVFESAQQKAMTELGDQLAEFRSKRTLGLGSIFGPSDHLLREAIRDKAKEARIIEQGLLPLLDSFSEDLENAKDRECAIASSLASLLYKLFNLKTAQAVAVIERCPLFVARDTRSKGIKFLKGSKKQNFLLTKGHHFSPQHYFNVTYCNHCQLIIWGVGNQGFQCQYCDMNIHKGCVRVIEENCIGARSAGKKDKKKDRVAGIVENIIGKSRKPSHNAADKLRRANDEMGDGSSLDGSSDSTGGDKLAHHHHHHHHQSSRVDKLCKAFEPVNENDDHRIGAHQHGDTQNHHPGQGPPTDGPSPSSESSRRGSQVVRSESLRTRRESKPSFRKRSDPNIPRSNSDVDGDDRPISGLNQSGSSSNSSLSTKSLDSPCNSLEAVHRSGGAAADATLSPLSSSTSPASGLPSSSSSVAQTRRDAEKYDSDLEVEADMPNWMDLVDAEVIRHMKPKEKKRQDVINELIHTERTHVRFLKVLERVFYRPMLTEQILPPDLFRLLFANLDEMIRIHGRLNGRLKRAKAESAVVGDIGDILLQMFDGVCGEEFKEAAATFCKNQSIALATFRFLNEKKTDPKVYQFHAEAMLNALCRRLGLPDILPMGMQRLTKYPLLLENLAKYTCPTTDEHGKIVRALECSKEILNHVNHAIKEAENNHKLIEIQKKMDRGPFEKTHHPITLEFRNLDLTRHKMQHAGNLTWRIVRQKSIEVEVLLLEDVLVLLQKQDDKFVLKYHNISLTSGREETKLIYSPIIKLNNLLTRNVATDKKAFFLVSTSPVGPQIYELVAMSSNDRKTWLRHISEATESYKARDGKNKRPEHPNTTITAPSCVERRESSDGDVVASVVAGFKSPEALISHDTHEGGVGEEDENASHDEAVATTNSSSALDASVPSVPSASDDGLSPQSTVNNKNSLDLTVGTSTGTPGEDASGLSADQLLGSSPSVVMGLLSPQQGTSPLLPSPSSGGVIGGAVSPTSSSPSPRRHFQRVEILQIAEGPSLIDPHEVVVSEGAVLQTAEPVLAPIEKLRRKDRVIRSALQEKLQLVAEILHIPPPSGSDNEDYDPEDNWLPSSDVCAVSDSSRLDVKELVMAAVIQATRLDKVIESLKISEEDAVNSGSNAPSSSPTPTPTPISDTIPIPSGNLRSGSVSPRIPCSPSTSCRVFNSGVASGGGVNAGSSHRSPALPVDRLVSISGALNANLTQLLALVAEREDERERLRKELRASRGQIHLLHDASRRRTPTSPLPSSPKSQSRPNSFVSLGSSGSDHLGVDPIDIAIDVDQDVPVPAEIPRTLEAYNKLVSIASTQQPLPDDATLRGVDNAACDGGGWGAEECESGVELFVDAPSESCTDSAAAMTSTESHRKDDGETAGTSDGKNLDAAAASSPPVYGAVF